MKRRTPVVFQELATEPSEFSTRNGVRVDNSRGNVIDITSELAQIPSPSPTFSLFSRFQERNVDFDGDWMMFDGAEASQLVSPINQELMQKLRQHQDIAQTKRGDVVATFSADWEDKISAAATKTSVAALKEVNSAEDEEYTLGEKYNTAKGQKDESCSNVHFDGSGDGIQGEYLGFLPAAGAKDDVAKNDLQATLTMKEGEDGMTFVNVSLQQQQQDRSLTPSAAAQHCVVPLWSVERFTKRNGYSFNSLIALHQEICDFVEYMRPSQAEIQMRNLIAMEVRSIAKRLWPDCDPIVFGSMSTGLLLPLSDLDMSILNVPMPVEDALIALAREIGREGLCHAAYPQLILKTKVPLVKFQHRLSMLDVDISINAVDGKRNSAIVFDMLRSFPEARPLTLLVKYFLQQRDMHEPYYGGLGSFATTLLVISFLQHHPIYTSRPEERSCSGLGRLLVDFFRYYGMYFNYERCGVSLLNGGRYFRRTDTSMLMQTSMAGQNAFVRQAQVVIEDPGCKENNAASSLRSFHVITSLFTYAYMALTASFDAPCGEGAYALSPDSTEVVRRPTLLSRILHVDAASVSRRRFIAAAYDALMQDPAQRERLLEAAATSYETLQSSEETFPRGVSSLDCIDGAGGSRPGRVATATPITYVSAGYSSSNVSSNSSDISSNSSNSSNSGCGSCSRTDDNSMQGSSSNDSSVRMVLRSSLV